MTRFSRSALGLLGSCLAGAALVLAPPAGANGGAVPPDRPFAMGHDFEALDDYLAHLQELGGMGITWYERQPDGTYMMIRRRPPGTPPEIFTRQELLDRFGFEQ
jgi:hypothetical protein